MLRLRLPAGLVWSGLVWAGLGWAGLGWAGRCVRLQPVCPEQPVLVQAYAGSTWLFKVGASLACFCPTLDTHPSPTHSAPLPAGAVCRQAGPGQERAGDHFWHHPRPHAAH